MKRPIRDIIKEGLNTNLIALSIATGVFLFWVFILFKKYYTFGYCDWDLAFFSQGMYGLLNGHAYSSLFENNLLGNHSNIIAYLIAPIFAIFPGPLTLVVLKIMSYSLAGLILFHIALPHTGRKYAFPIMLLYYAYLPNVFGLLHDFDFESLSPAFLMLLILFFERKYWRAFIITSCLTILIKENMPLVVAAFGLYALAFEKDKVRWGLIPILLGGVSFVYLVKIFIPAMSLVSTGGEHPYTYIYSGIWQNGFLGAFNYVWGMLFATPNLMFLHGIFAVFFFLPVLALGALFPVLPLFLQHALSSAETHHSLRFYYVLAIAPFVFYALVLVVERFKKILRPISFIFLFLLCVSAYYLQWSSYWPIVQRSFQCDACQKPTEENASLQWSLLSQIPDNVGVIATFGYLTQLAANPQLYAFYKLYSEIYQRPGSQWQLPTTVKYALINLDDPWFYPYAPDDLKERFSLVLSLLGGAERWQLISLAGKTVLFKKKE